MTIDDWKKRQLEEIRKRSGGHMTAMEILVAVGGAAYGYSVEAVERHAKEYAIPHLCGPMGRIYAR